MRPEDSTRTPGMPQDCCLVGGWLVCDIYLAIRTEVLGQSRSFPDVPNWRRGQGDRWSKPDLGGGSGPARERRGRSVQSGDPGHKASGIQELGNHKGESPPQRPLTLTYHCNKERAPMGPSTTGGKTHLDRMRYWESQTASAGKAKLRVALKLNTEMVRKTTTPTRLWGRIAYGSQNPMQQLHPKH